LDGYEATRQIRSRERCINESLSTQNLEAEANDITTPEVAARDEGHLTKIIALTASAFEEQRQVMMQVGCDDFMRKPFKAEELLEKIRQHLGVQFIYKDELRVANPSSAYPNVDSDLLKARGLASMPIEWLEELHYAAALGSDDLIMRLIQQIPEEGQQLATLLHHLASVFQFDRIIALIEPLLPGDDA
jgi:CheY-like chemotaxis protein